MQSDIISVKSKNPQNFGFQARRVILVRYRGKSGAPYWRFVEFGTQKMAPRPFMRPAFDTQKEAALATIISSIASDIPSIAKQVGGS